MANRGKINPEDLVDAKIQGKKNSEIAIENGISRQAVGQKLKRLENKNVNGEELNGKLESLHDLKLAKEKLNVALNSIEVQKKKLELARLQDGMVLWHPALKTIRHSLELLFTRLFEDFENIIQQEKLSDSRSKRLTNNLREHSQKAIVKYLNEIAQDLEIRAEEGEK